MVQKRVEQDRIEQGKRRGERYDWNGFKAVITLVVAKHRRLFSPKIRRQLYSNFSIVMKIKNNIKLGKVR